MYKQGLVIKSVGGNFFVRYEKDVFKCTASKKLSRKKNQIYPGDVVRFDSDDLYIYEIKQRTNQLVRPKIANINKVILVFSFDEPKISFSLLDRMILIMTYNDLDITLLLTKEDLVNNDKKESILSDLKYYLSFDINIIQKKDIIQYKDDINLEKAKYLGLFSGDKAIITGQSGVGKSTFLNEVFGMDLETAAISKSLGRGKHTTRESTFYDLNISKDIEDTIFLVDTPGFSSLDLNLKKEQIRDNYKDFKKLSIDCKFNDCYHLNEPGCNVKHHYYENELLKSRYENYVKIMEEL